MAVCPNGHDSVTEDFCDACGTRIATSPIRVIGKHHAGSPRPAGSPDDRCPWCGNLSSGQFCEQCGFRVRRPFPPLTPPLPATSLSPAPAPSLDRDPAPAPDRDPAPAPDRDPAPAPDRDP